MCSFTERKWAGIWDYISMFDKFSPMRVRMHGLISSCGVSLRSLFHLCGSIYVVNTTYHCF